MKKETVFRITVLLSLLGFAFPAGQFGKNHLGDRDEHLPAAPTPPIPPFANHTAPAARRSEIL